MPPDLFRAVQVENVVVERAGVLAHIADRIIEKAIEQAKAKKVANIQKKISEGDPASAIISHANEIDADLIVLGTRGLGEVESMFMGSVSRKVTNLADANVMIVK